MERLFVYGSLQPGAPNEHVLSSIEGDWEPAVVKGNLVEAGWGAAMGYSGLVIDERGSDIHGQIIASSSLGENWDYLDALEGDEYQRIIASVTTNSGEKVEANVYVLRP
jgi:gamma-glutamylcyclotransferase (GGCT)/AIG2-like uncharacterized protein YtfP